MPEGSHSAPHQDPMGEESPALSSPLSSSEHERPNVDSGPDCCPRPGLEPLDGDGERPVSLVSTLSSGSSRDSRSLFGSTVALPSSATPPSQSEEDIDLELSPAESAGDRAGDRSPTHTWSRARWQERLEPRLISSQWNKKASNRKANEIPQILASPVVTHAMAPNPKLTYLDRVVMEIIETERMYVKDLRSIVEDYLAHIIDLSNLPIRPEQVCALFGNIEDIYEFNSELLQSLDLCENNPVAIARCFVDKSEYFEIYTQYCTNYPNSVAALTDCMRSKTLAKFFRERQAALRRSLPLGSYLLKPVQRILKYHLLLQEIAKHFDSDEDGYDVIQEAIDTMTGVAWYINDMKRKHEHAVRVQEIQSLLINWKGSDLTTYGELVLEGTFHVLRAKNTRTLFLFQKMLLITKKRGEHYVYKVHISCSTLMLLDSAKDPLLFSVIHFKHPKQPHTVQAKSVEEKRLWAHHIKRLILENHNAIVPPKSKEAILDNSNYPGKFHYSPERLKKTESCHADDFHLGDRYGRRRSEPAKRIIRSTKAVLKHADSEGALLGERSSLQPHPSVSTLVEDPDSPQQLSPTDSEPKAGSPASEGRLEGEEEEEGEEGEDILMGDDQDEQMRNVESPVTEEVETQREEEKQTPSTQVNVDELCPLECVLQATEVHDSQSPKSPSQQEADTPEDTSRDATAEDEEAESDSSAPQVEETSSLTNGELSEEEEEALSDNKSILPSSVLDQASMIAERFISSLSRRSSLVSEDLGSLACPSPPIDNEVFKSPSACMDLETQMLASSSPEVSSTPVQDPELTALMKEELRSTLSKQDRLLIRKIRTYYEHAEHQDANFSIKRRESLSYIPAGLVRLLSRQLNTVPQEPAAPVQRKGLSPNRPTSWSVFDLPGLEKTRSPEANRKTEPSSAARSQSVTESSATEEEFRSSSDMLKVWEEMETDSQEVLEIREDKPNNSRLEATKDIPPLPVLEESEIGTDASSVSSLTPPAMEAGPCHDSTVQDKSNNAQLPKIISFRTSMDEDQILQDMGKMKNKVFQLARQYSQRIKNNRPMAWQKNRERANQQSFKTMPSVQEEKPPSRKKGKPSLRLPLSTCEESVVPEESSPSPVQSPTSSQSAVTSSQSAVTSSQSAVTSSQSAVTSSQSAVTSSQSAVTSSQSAVTSSQSAVTSSQSAVTSSYSAVTSSQSAVTSSQSPTSSQSAVICPQTPPSDPEPFHWPHVQELRSKYTDAFHAKVTRSATVPNGMPECCTSRCNDCSHKYSSSSDLHRTQSEYKDRRPGTEDWAPPRLQPLLCRWSSLDHMLGSLPIQNFQEPVSSLTRDKDMDGVLQDGLDVAPKPPAPCSGKLTESNLVKSLREKFQSLTASS